MRRTSVGNVNAKSNQTSAANSHVSERFNVQLFRLTSRCDYAVVLEERAKDVVEVVHRVVPEDGVQRITCDGFFGSGRQAVRHLGNKAVVLALHRKGPGWWKRR